MTKVGTERNHAEPIASHLDTAAAEPIARLVDIAHADRSMPTLFFGL